MDELALARLNAGLQAVAATCFDPVPQYQCLRGTRAAYRDKVITVAYGPDGRVSGFCSAILLDVPDLPSVLHLGLTCVDPVHRGQRLTHLLTSKLALGHLLRTRPHGRVWITNVACVLSSVGSVALNFDAVYPSPFGAVAPSPVHRRIAQVVAEHYRDDIAIDSDAHFDAVRFVFRGSVKGSVFQKSEQDERFHHRDSEVNDFYRGLLRFDEGDEVLQIGHFSLATLVRYLKRGKGRRRRTRLQAAA
jgi:hypothetical protein